MCTMVYNENTFKMKSTAKYFVWTLPTLLIALMASMVLLLQACQIPVHIQNGHKYVNIQDVYTSFAAYGLILLMGTGFSLYTLIQVNKISRGNKYK